MKPAELLIGPECRRQLGEEGLIRVAAALHAQAADCQTCVRPLQGHQMSLAVDTVTPFAVASIHHARCRSSDWNEGVVVLRAGRPCTYSMSHWVVLTDNDQIRALIMLNPSLESVILAQDPVGWHPRLAAGYLQAGMKRHIPLHTPPLAAGIRATVTRDGTIQITTPEGDVYPDPSFTSRMAPEMIDVARQQGVIMFAVTHAVDPMVLHEMHGINVHLDHPLTLTGLVSLH